MQITTTELTGKYNPLREIRWTQGVQVGSILPATDEYVSTFPVYGVQVDDVNGVVTYTDGVREVSVPFGQLVEIVGHFNV